jgi:hypothetical protein
MSEAGVHSTSVDSVETVLRAELAQGDALLGKIVPILRHLVANDDQSVFSEEIVARTRGMMEHVARQLLAELQEALERPDLREEVDALVSVFSADAAFLGHVHSLALEWQLTERLSQRTGLDPVLSPLLQDLVTSPEPEIAALAVDLLAAQASFAQAQRRMQLPMTELPADLIHGGLMALREVATGHGVDRLAIDRCEAAVRQKYDEGRSRLGLCARIVLGLVHNALDALSVEYAGVALFLTTLGIASGQERSLAVLSTNEGQVTRLALVLSAAGLQQRFIEKQFLSLHPELGMPRGFDQLGPERAAALLANSVGYSG